MPEGQSLLQITLSALQKQGKPTSIYTDIYRYILRPSCVSIAKDTQLYEVFFFANEYRSSRHNKQNNKVLVWL